MGYNPSNKNTYYYIDEYGMMLCRFARNQGRADSVGRTVLATIAYCEDQLFKNVLSNCIINLYPPKIIRHPEIEKPGISRDHVTYLFVGLKYFQRERLLKILSKEMRWKISDFAKFTPDMWCWMKGIAGSRFYLWLFYRIEIFWMRLMSLWNRTIRKIGRFHLEFNQWDYKMVNIVGDLQITSLQRKLRKWLYPAYSLHILGWQLYVLKDCKSKRRLQRICLKMTGRYNYLVRLLFGDQTVTLDDVNNYQHMTSWRWGVNLDETNDRDTYIIPNLNLISDNALETDLLRKVWDDHADKTMIERWEYLNKYLKNENQNTHQLRT